MPETKEVLVPDIGDFADVEIIEILVSTGDLINKEDSLITLESDKATMDIPSPLNGKVENILVTVGDKVVEGTPIVSVQLVDEENSATDTSHAKKIDPSDSQETNITQAAMTTRGDIHAEVVVLGAGPGGYTAAFRSADLGKKTILIERYSTLGGVCLNVGCIPSKALLHIAKVITEIEELKEAGIDLGQFNADKKPIRAWTESIVNKLTVGLKQMAKQRKVEVLYGNGTFTSTNTIEVTTEGKKTTVSFDHAIIAAGSQPAMIPGLPDDARIMDSTSSLLLDEIPKRLLVIGGGIIGLEMA